MFYLGLFGGTYSVLDFTFQGTEVIPTPDQDATDFTKGLKIVVERLQQQNTQVGFWFFFFFFLPIEFFDVLLVGKGCSVGVVVNTLASLLWGRAV